MNSSALDTVRSNKILGIALFDLLGSFAVFGAIGNRVLGTNYITAGLMSVPISVLIHHLSGVPTPLSDFVTSGSPHVYHAPLIGAVVGGAVKLAGVSNINSFNTFLGTSIFAIMYMQRYQHGLPKSVRKKLVRFYLKYKQMRG